jgi:microcystin-dependent protein
MPEKPEQSPPSAGVNPPAALSRREMLRAAFIGGAVVMVSGCVDRETPLEPGDQKIAPGVVSSDEDIGPKLIMGEIRIMSFNFPPKGWALCNGQFLQISQNQALFALLGTTYGGNGQTTFALPNLRGRVPIHMSAAHTIGEAAGSTSVTLNIQQLPTHTHTMQASSNSTGTQADPTNTVLGPANGLYSLSLMRMVDPAEFKENPDKMPADLVRISVPVFANDAAPTTTLSPSSITSVGGSQPHNNMQPYGVVNCCIALQGLFPDRP